MGFRKATRRKAKLRLALHAPSGGGKTYSALRMAMHLAQGGGVAVIDTERGSSEKYANKLDPTDQVRFEFDVDEIVKPFSPDKLTRSLKDAAAAGYAVCVIDSLTHFWNADGGILEIVDQEAKRIGAARGRHADSFDAWKKGSKVYNDMVQALLDYPGHLIFTMRAKQEYVKEEKNGKTQVRKVGMAPEMRDGFQYEADVEGMLDLDHNLVIGKTRCEDLDGQVFTKPGADIAEILLRWLDEGAPADEKPKAPPTRSVEPDHQDNGHAPVPANHQDNAGTDPDPGAVDPYADAAAQAELAFRDATDAATMAEASKLAGRLLKNAPADIITRVKLIAAEARQRLGLAPTGTDRAPRAA